MRRDRKILERAFILWGVFSLLGLSVGCVEESAGDRFLAQQALGHTTFQELSLGVFLDPGTQPSLQGVEDGVCDVTQAVAAQGVALRLSSPGGTAILERGGLCSGEVDCAPYVYTVFSNILEQAEITPQIVPVDPQEDPECALPEDAAALFLAPIELVSLGDNRYASCLHLPPCTRMTLTIGSVSDLGEQGEGDPLRLAVFGEVQGNSEIFSAIVEDARGWGAQALVSLGNLANSEALADLNLWRSEFIDPTGMPFIAVLGEEEAVGGANLPFHQVFGRSDFSSVIGDIRLLVMDTASAELSDDQERYWDAVLQENTEKVVLSFMNIPPFDPVGVRDNGFISRVEAAHFTSFLGENGVDAVFTGGIGSYGYINYSGLDVYSTGGGGGSLESRSDYQHHYLRVTVAPGEDSEVDVVLIELD